jgi:uncharacterized membrane protein
MAENDIGQMANAVAASVTGPNSPDSVKVSRPTTSAIWTLFAALAIVCAFAAAVIAILTWHVWPAGTAPQRIQFLGWMGIIAVGCIPVIVFALASPWVGKIEASAGPGHITLEGKAP